MTNTMPMLTDEQREELIEFAKEEFHCWNDGGPYQQLLQIAVAAMTTEPVAYMLHDKTPGGRHSWVSLTGIGSIDPEDVSEYEICQDSLYNAPPVPALKLPEESDLDPGALVEPVRRVAFMNGARFAIGEVKRMNGVTK